MRRAFFIPFAVLVLLGTGCAMMQVYVEPLDKSGKEYPEVDPEDVRVYKSEKSAPQGAKRLAELEVSVAGDLGDNEGYWEKVVLRLKKEAGALGANGLILGKRKLPDGGRVAASILVGVPAESSLTAIAILAKSPAKKQNQKP